MVVIIKSKSTRKSIAEALKKLQTVKGFDARKHCGVLSLATDPLSLQLIMRDEWNRDTH